MLIVVSTIQKMMFNRSGPGAFHNYAQHNEGFTIVECTVSIHKSTGVATVGREDLVDEAHVNLIVDLRVHSGDCQPHLALRTSSVLSLFLYYIQYYTFEYCNIWVWY